MNLLQKTASVILGNPAGLAPSVHHFRIDSVALHRMLAVDIYLPPGYTTGSGMLYPMVLFNDGQDLPRMHFEQIFEKLTLARSIRPFIAVGIRAGEQRIREYGTVQQADYKGRGNLAPLYSRFVLEELLPQLREQFAVSPKPQDTAFAGFSLGGLSAIDIAWAQPEVFGVVGVFSGSLWWRSLNVRPEAPDADRIMHNIVEKAKLTIRILYSKPLSAPTTFCTRLLYSNSSVKIAYSSDNQ